jgi:hypothetical protein
MRGFAQAVERRQFGRRQTNVHAFITARGRPRMPCVMRDISEGGALLEVHHPEWLPARFRLIAEASGFERECEVAHRTDASVGVRFLVPARVEAVRLAACP